jgi:hypothetical protein
MAGSKVFFRQLKRQIYSRATLIGLEKNLDTDIVRIPSKLEYSLRLASEEDIGDIFQKIETESKESDFELIQRKMFYEAGFRNCYVARSVDTNEICHINWLISSEEDNVVSHGFRSRLPKLKEDEVLIENAFTVEEYKGNWIWPSVIGELFEIARTNGFKRVITYVSRENMASLKGCERAGMKRTEEVPELKLLFFTKRKHN